MRPDVRTIHCSQGNCPLGFALLLQRHPCLWSGKFTCQRSGNSGSQSSQCHDGPDSHGHRSSSKNRIGFLAKKALFFNGPASAFLEALGAIPVARKEDLSPGENFDNNLSFQKACEFLNAEGTLLVFPEGVSKIERNLRKIKTGTARIAFQLEESTGFSSSLKIITVALHYSDPTRFRSKVTVLFDRPISVDHYKAMHSATPEICVQSLTKRIERRLFNKTVISEEEETLGMVADLYSIHLQTTHAHRNDPKTALFLAKNIGKAISRYKYADWGKYAALFEETLAYRDLLKKHLLHVKAYHQSVAHQDHPGLFALKFTGVALLFPFYMLGAIINSLPYLVAVYVTPMISREEEFKAGLQLALGVIAFPVWYIILSLMVSQFFSSNHNIPCYLLQWLHSRASFPFGFIP